MKVEPLKKVRFSEHELTFLEKLKHALPNVLILDEFRGRRGRRGARGHEGEPGKLGEPGNLGERGLKGAAGRVGSIGLPGLIGEQGLRGKRGYKGLQGRAADIGPPGPPGPKGDIGPAPEHEWQGGALRFRKPNGVWGKLVNLLGPAGGRGGRGQTGGGSMANVEALIQRARSMAYFLGE